MEFVSIILAGTTSTWQDAIGKKYSILDYPLIDNQSLLQFSYQSYKSDFLTIIASALSRGKLQDFQKTSQSIQNYEIKKVTNGALSTLALLTDLIPTEYPIVVAPVDGIVNVKMAEFIKVMQEDNLECGMIAFKGDDPRYSYVRKFGNQVLEVAEKKVIGSLALSGVYYFKNLDVLLKCISWAFVNKASTNGIYYISNAVNGLIATNSRVGILEIPTEDYYRYSDKIECINSEKRRQNS